MLEQEEPLCEMLIFVKVWQYWIAGSLARRRKERSILYAVLRTVWIRYMSPGVFSEVGALSQSWNLNNLYQHIEMFLLFTFYGVIWNFPHAPVH